jgi:DNA-binding NarL/FixJ family response regulator
MARRDSAARGVRPSARQRDGALKKNGADTGNSRPARCRVVVAARPALVCEALCVALENTSSLEVAGQARDEEETLRVVKQKRPAVVLFDYEGLGPSIEKAIQRLRRAARKTRILVLATRSSDETVERVLRAGASGLVGKQQSLATLVHAIQAVAAGELWANRRATAHVVELLSGDPDRSEPPGERLTHREWEITEAVGRGLRNKEIAHSLRISEKTVKSHLNNIFRKLRVDNRFAVGLYSLDRVQLKT